MILVVIYIFIYSFTYLFLFLIFFGIILIFVTFLNVGVMSNDFCRDI